MGGSYLEKINCEDTSPNLFACNCSCEVPGADDDLCVHYFEELDFSSFDISGDEEIDDGLDLDELETDLSQVPIFHVDETENIFDRNGPESESLSNGQASTEGLASAEVSACVKGEKSNDATGNKSERDLTKTSASNNSLRLCDKSTYNSDPEPRKIVSAMKGSRAKEGIAVGSGLRVRWAPDVYDPPITSDDHTLKKAVYRPRTKSVRKDHGHKYKHSKSKTSQQGRSRSQHTSKSSSQNTIDQRMLRSLARQGKAPMANLAVSKIHHVNATQKVNANEDGTISEAKELKFGGSFCREPVASRVHFPLAEAT